MDLPPQWLIIIVKVVSWRLLKIFDPFVVLSVLWSSERGLFGHLSNYISRNQYFQKHIRYEGLLFLANVQKLIYILKMQKKKKFRKIFFLFDIIASGLIALNCFY